MGLRYVSSDRPGISRVRVGDGFRYRGPDRRLVRDGATLERIRALAIPPAYSDVWICPHPNGHLQAVGRDARGRKQYRYHSQWRAIRDAVKYERMLAFGDALPRIRERVDADLSLPGMPRDKVLAAVVSMLEQTLVRVGNDEYARENRSFGLTTLRTRHVRAARGGLHFQFKGKSGKEHNVLLSDRRLVRVVRRCLEIPGQELFQWVDAEGGRHGIDSADVNAYIQEISGEEFTAKDFRTWAGTVLAARFLRATGPVPDEREQRSSVARVIEQVAQELRNTPAVCRKSYIHPAVIDSFLMGLLQPFSDQPGGDDAGRRRAELSVEERELLELLREGAQAVTAATALAS